MILSKRFRYLAVIWLAVWGLANIIGSATILLVPTVYRKDFIQEYLLAKAVLNGVNPYLPLPDLAELFIGPIPATIIQHPTPHPPPVAILSLPLGLLSYQPAAVVWFIFEIGCVIASVYLLQRWMKIGLSPAYTLLFASMTFAWEPFAIDLASGQLMTLLLLTLTIAWLSLRSGNDTLGGAMLGCTVALKLMAWPIIIFLVLRKNWRAVAAAGTVIVTANVAAALLMGFGPIAYYYMRVGAVVTPLYRAHSYNFSTYSIGWRFFEGTSSLMLAGINAAPLVLAPHIAQYVSITALLAVLVIGLTLASRVRSFDAAFGILVGVSVLVSPIAWAHYSVLILIPVVIAARLLLTLCFPKRETYHAAIVAVLLAIPPVPAALIELLFANGDASTENQVTVPFAAGLLTLAPMVAILGLLWLIWRLDHYFVDPSIVLQEGKP